MNTGIQSNHESSALTGIMVEYQVARDLEMQFRDGHRDYPELYVQGFLDGEWLLRGPGSGRFRLLAQHAAKAAGYSGGRACEFWLKVVKDYLLRHDPHNEGLARLSAVTGEKPAPWRQPIATTGEIYVIQSVFEASADCCLHLGLSTQRSLGVTTGTAIEPKVTSQLTPSGAASDGCDSVSTLGPQSLLSQPVQRWEDIELRFVSDERVQIFICGKPGPTANFAELGFEDRRGKGGKPSGAWRVLLAIAESNGIIPANAISGRQETQKRAQTIRQRLCRGFHIAENPLPFVEGTGYRARFKITLSPAHRT